LNNEYCCWNPIIDVTNYEPTSVFSLLCPIQTVEEEPTYVLYIAMVEPKADIQQGHPEPQHRHDLPPYTEIWSSAWRLHLKTFNSFSIIEVMEPLQNPNQGQT
jgi:hypothetical protein